MENQKIICHSLHLTEPQRYAIHNQETVETVGNYFVSNLDPKHVIRESFAKYLLTKNSDNFNLLKKPYGFEINFPKNPPIEENHITKFFNIEFEFNTKALLNVKDGGSEFMFIKHYQYKTMNLIQISTIEMLEFNCCL